MGKHEWSGKRTLEHCSLITQAGSTPFQYDGMCEGFAKSYEDDEPCETCRECRLHYTNAEEG